jgi:hypothetical protein
MALSGLLKRSSQRFIADDKWLFKKFLFELMDYAKGRNSHNVNIL